MYTEISALITSFKTMTDLTKTMIGLRDGAAMQAKIIEFQQVIMDAQQRVLSAQEESSALIEKVAALEKQLADMKRWETEKQRYEMKRVGYGGTAVVFQLKPDCAGSDEPHQICTHCYEDGAKSILQGDRSGGSTYLMCPRCKTRLITGGHGK